LKTFGYIATSAYGLFLVALVYVRWDLFYMLAPNEWGDFLAGTVGPVALLWVVLSFMLQSKELQNSVHALNLQTKELSESAAANIRLAQATDSALAFEKEKAALEAAKREKAILPDLILSYAPTIRQGGILHFKLKVTNVGTSISRFSLTIDPVGPHSLTVTAQHFQTGAKISNDGLKSDAPPESLSATVQFSDLEGTAHTWTYDLSLILNDVEWSEYDFARCSS
jgi:hypothetical protein